MSDIIQLLPDSVANQIAAGEVIQRPSSVVKELMENAVDAGALTINVLIVDAGRTSIQVIDDGKGMSETDARLSFERHATSKISKAEDLFSLHTMGFRGEALASIAAVAQVDLRSRQASDEIGTHLAISGSRFSGQEACGCPVGSNFKIENLFYNVPARRKFLKSNSTELNNILHAFERIVLVNPQLSFTLHSNGVELLNLKASSTRQRILDVFGKRLGQDLLPLSVDTTMCKINGFVGKLESARKRGVNQFFFVNGRYMKHPYFNKAVMNAYERMVPSGEQVPYFIYFDVPAGDIDVNIHPTKTEIKFENEQAIWQILSSTVKEAVGLFSEVPSIDFDTQGKPDIPVFNPSAGNVSIPKLDIDQQFNPFRSEFSGGASRHAPRQWEQLYQGVNKENEQDPKLFETPEENILSTDNDNIFADKSPIHYQYKAQFIMTAVKSGLMIIDQHRAHVRILYEHYISVLTNHNGTPQKVLFPEVIQFTPAEVVGVKSVWDELSEMGFELTDLGGGSYAINAVPSGLEGLNMSALVQEMVDSSISQNTSVPELINKTLALTLARNAAIPHGQVLNNEEMENIVNELFSCSNVSYTPDGKKIIGILRQTELDHLLG